MTEELINDGKRAQVWAEIEAESEQNDGQKFREKESFKLIKVFHSTQYILS